MISALLCLSPVFAESLFISKDDSRLPNSYLTEPTKYVKYMQLVLAIWMADNAVDIKYIVPLSFLANNNFEDVSSDSDEELLQPRVNIKQENSMNEVNILLKYYYSLIRGESQSTFKNCFPQKHKWELSLSVMVFFYVTCGLKILGGYIVSIDINKCILGTNSKLWQMKLVVVGVFL